MLEILNNLNINVFELISFDDFVPIYLNKICYEEEIDLLIYQNYYCLITNLHNFCERQ